MTKQIMIIADYPQQDALTLEELCLGCRVTKDFVYELIEYGIISPRPRGVRSEEWDFELAQVQRLRAVLRLQRDLELDLTGIAVVLELLDKIERLEARVALLEKLLR